MLNASLQSDRRLAGTRSLMAPQRWSRLRGAIAAAFDAPRENRDRVLAKACTGQPTLLSQARAMIRAAEDTNGFLEQPCVDGPELRSEVEALLAAYAPAAPSLESVGTIGPFTLIRRLGTGGMGEVFLAEDTRLRRRVALKFVRPELAEDSERLWRFEREALAAAALNHPNVATVYEVGEERGRRYIAMEYIEGMSLAAHIKQRSLGLRELVAIAIEVADALQEAHAKGIVHRDVKPSNVMVTPRGHAKILDFGVAKLATERDAVGGGSVPLTQETGASGLVGTANYMSPEQAQGLPVDARSDIFCFGVTLYEMATGRLPFEGALPVQLDSLVSRCLAKDREQRYATAHDLLADLRSVQFNLDKRLRVVNGKHAKQGQIVRRCARCRFQR